MRLSFKCRESIYPPHNRQTDRAGRSVDVHYSLRLLTYYTISSYPRRSKTRLKLFGISISFFESNIKETTDNCQRLLQLPRKTKSLCSFDFQCCRFCKSTIQFLRQAVAECQILLLLLLILLQRYNMKYSAPIAVYSAALLPLSLMAVDICL